jgi:Caspase domain
MHRLMRSAWVLVAIAASLSGQVQGSDADPPRPEKRVALVIGNTAYRHEPHVRHAIDDAKAVATMFRAAGFAQVTMATDLTAAALRGALREFKAANADADIAVVYYRGRGVEVDGTAYALPIDARTTPVTADAVSLDDIVAAIEPARRLRLVMLDFTRHDPFAMAARQRQDTRIAAVDRAAVQAGSAGLLVAHSAQAGRLVEDRADNPFTAALTRHLLVPGLDVRLAFVRIRDAVLELTAHRQGPVVRGWLGGEVVSLVPPAGEQSSSRLDIQSHFHLTRLVDSRRAWEIFIETHKSGPLVERGRGELRRLGAREWAVMPRRAVRPSPRSEPRRRGPTGDFPPYYSPDR